MDESSTLQEDIKQELIEVDEKIEEYTAQIELAEDIEALHKDERFQRVIMNGYLEAEAERLFYILTTPMNFKRDINENIMDKLGSIRDLKEWFGVKLKEAVMAPDSLEEQVNYRKQVTAKGSEAFGTEE